MAVNIESIKSDIDNSIYENKGKQITANALRTVLTTLADAIGEVDQEASNKEYKYIFPVNFTKELYNTLVESSNDTLSLPDCFSSNEKQQFINACESSVSTTFVLDFWPAFASQEDYSNSPLTCYITSIYNMYIPEYDEGVNKAVFAFFMLDAFVKVQILINKATTKFTITASVSRI